MSALGGAAVGRHASRCRRFARPDWQIRRRAHETHRAAVRRELRIRDAHRGEQIVDRHRPAALRGSERGRRNERGHDSAEST